MAEACAHARVGEISSGNTDMATAELDAAAMQAKQERMQALQKQLMDGFNLTPFNQHIGAKIVSVTHEEVRAEIAMQPFLVGNMFKQILHGGVIATLLDNVGGVAAMTAAYARLKGEPREEKTIREAPADRCHFHDGGHRCRHGSRVEGVCRVLHAAWAGRHQTAAGC